MNKIDMKRKAVVVLSDNVVKKWKESINDNAGTPSRFTDQSVDDANVSFNNLNDDCLTEIFEYLTNSDLLQVAKLGNRFKVICQSIVRRKGLKLNVNKIDTENSLKIFGTEAKKIVIDMKVFTKSSTPGTILSKISQYCPSVERVELIDFNTTEWEGEHVFDMEIQALRPPWVKQIIISDSSLLFGSELFHNSVDTLTIDLKSSDTIEKYVGVLFESNVIDAVLFWDDDYRTLQRYDILSVE